MENVASPPLSPLFLVGIFGGGKEGYTTNSKTQPARKGKNGEFLKGNLGHSFFSFWEWWSNFHLFSTLPEQWHKWNQSHFYKKSSFSQRGECSVSEWFLVCKKNSSQPWSVADMCFGVVVLSPINTLIWRPGLYGKKSLFKFSLSLILFWDNFLSSFFPWNIPFYTQNTHLDDFLWQKIAIQRISFPTKGPLGKKNYVPKLWVGFKRPHGEAVWQWCLIWFTLIPTLALFYECRKSKFFFQVHTLSLKGGP